MAEEDQRPQKNEGKCNNWQKNTNKPQYWNQQPHAQHTPIQYQPTIPFMILQPRYPTPQPTTIAQLQIPNLTSNHVPNPNTSQTTQPFNQVIGVIHLIFGGLPQGISQASLKIKARRPPPEEPIHKQFKRDEVITFSELDTVPDIMSHSDALVIKMILGNKEV